MKVPQEHCLLLVFEFPLGGEFRSVFAQTCDLQKILLSNKTISCDKVTSFREGPRRILIVFLFVCLFNSETFRVYFGLCLVVIAHDDLPRQ